ncbi:hypothetical protein GCM10010988_08170 [Cnuibacter physcomitrellae]|uniref:General stress protein 17M-like domain-containing protein n=1 Tax=Cnuibacter physcomitrellae TaxID=1619308 RepID=A0A1X9LKQ2_9MICO|nr:LapA family protein [Cnuibacter physcomitrellae]ARJ05697.1 hypothetical protein B5808_11035 [Cnuibacter physcomitrellae]GGI36282.1 hypothetical protein GCM10010988_08170 [Cnuibacter physcomitrellae]
MTNPTPNGRRGPLRTPVVPRGEVVATYETYPEAQEAVDRLAHHEFPVREVSIVGSDLKTVEQVTGTMSYGRAALTGAVSGLWLGVFFGLLFLIFSPQISLAFLLAAVLIGAAFGMLFSLAAYALNRRRRDFTSVMQVVASSYSVIVEPEHANRARNLLDGGATSGPGAGSGAANAPEAPHPSEPPRA